VRFGISIPQFFGDREFDPTAFEAYLARAEELEFDGAWTGEQVLGTMPHLGPLETLSYAAAVTRHIRLGVAALVLPLYSPLHLAKSVASLDQLSRGRIDLGITLGGRFRQFAAFGVDPATLVARFTEQIRLMKLLWTEDRLDFEGRFWQLKGAAMEPKPFQKPHPPLWFAASNPNALRRAVALGDRFIGAGSQTTEQFREQAAVVREALAERPAGGPAFIIAKRVYIAVDTDGDRARHELTKALNRLYGYFGMPNIDALGIGGTAETCIAELRAVQEAGAEMIVLNPVYDDREQMERLAAEVVPSLLDDR
jgi:alkanesulfonate monooxygenase SsuD/methylene tetrahydromethanopterin reductase-like flavin-dependent oxidoreductase (luciferase family)